MNDKLKKCFMGKIGFIYIFTNKSFSGHDWVKIGYSDDVERRRKELSSTGLPFDFEIYATYELPVGVSLADKALHNLIQRLNSNLRLNPSREFFELKPEDAFAILDSLATIHGRKDKLLKYSNNIPINNVINISKQKVNALSYVKRIVSENDIRARIISLPKCIVEKIINNTKKQELDLCINNSFYCRVTFCPGRNYLSGVTNFLKEFDFVDNNGNTNSKEVEIAIEKDKIFICI